MSSICTLTDLVRAAPAEEPTIYTTALLLGAGAGAGLVLVLVFNPVAVVNRFVNRPCQHFRGFHFVKLASLKLIKQ